MPWIRCSTSSANPAPDSAQVTYFGAASSCWPKRFTLATPTEFMKANQDKDGGILTDTAITAKVKASLLAQRGIPSAAISVETYESRVLLSGFVDSEAVKTKAGKLDAGVSGVKQV